MVTAVVASRPAHAGPLEEAVANAVDGLAASSEEQIEASIADGAIAALTDDLVRRHPTV